MRIITKYLGTTIITYILMVMLLLFGLHAFIEFMREFPNIGTGSYGVFQVLTFVPLMLPSDVYQFFPMASLLGCVIALGLLASHSELIVMRAAGVSLANVMLIVAKTAVILILVMLIVGEVVAPRAQRVAIRNKNIAMSGGQTLITQQGTWVRSGNNFLHIDYVVNEDELHGITRYEFAANGQLKAAHHAASGVYQNGKWVFKNIDQTVFADDRITNVSFPEQQWELMLNRRLMGMALIDPDQETLPQLYSYIKYRKQGGLNAVSYEFIFWQRVVAPLATLIMTLLAVPFVFGPLRSSSMGLRMLVGVMIGFGFYVLDHLVGSMSVVYQVSPMLAATLPTIIFMIIGSIMWFKVR